VEQVTAIIGAMQQQVPPAPSVADDTSSETTLDRQAGNAFGGKESARKKSRS
jgi:hypothetical protein